MLIYWHPFCLMCATKQCPLVWTARDIARRISRLKEGCHQIGVRMHWCKNGTQRQQALGSRRWLGVGCGFLADTSACVPVCMLV